VNLNSSTKVYVALTCPFGNDLFARGILSDFIGLLLPVLTDSTGAGEVHVVL
jgi:hypothetical protein